MITHILPYGKIIVLQTDIAEIIINQGVEMEKASLSHMFHLLKEKLQMPFGLLFNKTNSYAYSFDAQRLLELRPEINAVAVIAHNNAGEQSARYLVGLSKTNINTKIFYDRAKALQWLQEQQDRITKPDSEI